MSNSDDLLREGIDDFINAALKEEASEIRDGINDNSGDDSAGVQQSTMALNANTQALKANNEEKQKTLTIDQAINNAIQESLKQRNEMLVYHGTSANFNKFNLDNKFTGAGSESFGHGVYTTGSKDIGYDYAKKTEWKGVGDRWANDPLFISQLKAYNLDDLKDSPEELEKWNRLYRERLIEDFNEKIEEHKKSLKEEDKRIESIIKDTDNSDSFNKNSLAYASRYKKMLEYNINENKNVIEFLKNNSLQDISNYKRYENSLLYHLAIPKDGYLEESKKYKLEDFDTAKVSEDVSNLMVRYFGDILSRDGTHTGEEVQEKLREKLGDENASSALSQMGYYGYKYKAGQIHGNPYGEDYNYVVYDPENVRILKKEQLNTDVLENAGSKDMDSSIVQTVQYVDQSLKELADAFTSTTRVIEGKSLSVNAGGDTYNVNATKVNDLILRKDGTAYVTDDADEIIATKNLAGLGSQTVREEKSGKTVGVLTEDQVVKFIELVDKLGSLSTNRNDLIKADSVRSEMQYMINMSARQRTGNYNNLYGVNTAVNEFADSLDGIKDIKDPEEKINTLKSALTELEGLFLTIDKFDPQDLGQNIEFLKHVKEILSDDLSDTEIAVNMRKQSESYFNKIQKLEEDSIEEKYSGILDSFNEVEIGRKLSDAYDEYSDSLLDSLEANEKVNSDLKDQDKAIREYNEYMRTHIRRGRYNKHKKEYKIGFIESEKIKNREDDWLKLRNLQYDFNRYKSQIEHRYTENVVNESGFIVGTRNKVSNTRTEDELVKNTRLYATSLNTMYDGVLNKYNQIKKIEDQLYNGKNTKEEQVELLKKLEEASDDYGKSMKSLLETFGKANKDTITNYASAIQEFVKNGGNVAGQRLRDAKYSFIRNKEQTAILQAEGYLTNYNTSGYLKDSWNKTLFNRATGYRQQRGLVGFASNLGYNALGVGPALGLGMVATGLKKLGKATLEFTKQSEQAYSKIETVRTNLGIVYGSQSEADTTFDEIAQYATKSPFGVETVSQFAVQLKQSGVYASNLMDTLKQIGDVAGGNQQKFGNIANAFAQIEANGKATTRQLREFATAGIPIYAQLSKQLGKTVEQIRTMTAQGQISSTIIEEAFAQMTGEGGMFHNAVNIGAKTWAARKQNLADARQLAQAQLGQWALNIGGTSSTDNDSVAKGILTWLEKFYGSIENLFLLGNIDKNVNAITEKDIRVKELEEAIEFANRTGNKELSQILSKQLTEELSKRNVSQERADNAKAVGLYINSKAEYDEKKALINSYNKQIEDLIAQRETDELGRAEDIHLGYHSVKNVELQKSIDILQGLLDDAEDGLHSLSKTMKNTRDYYYDTLKMSDYYISKTESIIQKGYDRLDSTAKKGNGLISEVGTPNSMYKMYQTSVDKYKQTPAGKLEIENKAMNEWEAMRSQYDTFDPLLSQTAILTKDNIVSLKTLSEIMKSGIINPLEKFDFSPEKMSNSLKLATQNGRTLEDNNNAWKALVDKVDSLRRIDLSDMSDKEIKGLQRLLASTFGGTTSDFATVINENGEKVFDNVSNFNEALVNTPEVIKKLNKVFFEFFDSLGQTNPNIADTLLQYLSSSGEKVGKSKSYTELNDLTATPYPLWQRILSNSLGVDLNLFKNAGSKKGFITNGTQAMDIFKGQAQRSTVKNIMAAMLANGTYRKTLGLISTGDKEGVVSNNSKDGTLQINWKETYKGFTDFSTGLEALSKTTRAYADSLGEQENALIEFLSSSITQTEDPANIWDKQYQNVLGEYANNIKAVDANAYDLLFEQLGNGFIKMRENAPAVAMSMLDFTHKIKLVTESMASLKEETEGLKQSVKESDVRRSILQKYGANYETIGNKYNLNREDSESLVNRITEMAIKEGTSDSALYKMPKEEIENLVSDILAKNVLKIRKYEINDTELQKLENKAEEEKSKLAKLDYRNNSEYKKIAEKIKEYDKAFSGKEMKGQDKEAYESLKSRQKQIEDDYKKQAEVARSAESSVELTKTNNSELEELNARMAELTALITENADNIVKDIKSSRGLSNQQIYEGYIAKQDYFNSPWLDGQKMYLDNSYTQQKILNGIGVDGSFRQFADSLILNSDGTINQKMLSSLKEKAKGKDAEILSASGSINDETLKDTMAKVLEDTLKWQLALNNIKSTFEELGKTAKDTLFNGILNGINQSTQTWGKNLYLINEQLMTSEESGKAIASVWKNIGVEMLNAIGPAMTQAGLNVIAKATSKGEIIAGIGLVAAGGVTNILSGYLGASKETDDKKAEEQRLQNLRDLLKEIIDQAKTDAQYYENNMRHQNAISMQREISVNDAIITPNGNVVSTHPDDYLIATKTPGALMNGGRNGDVKVNFTLVDQSTGGKVQVNDVKQNKNADGSIDIQAMVVALTAQAIADGSMDDAFASRDVRLRGRSYYS